MRMDRTKGHARSHPQAAPISPWLCAVARATRVHRAELSQRGRARRATNHAGSARANTTSGPAPLLSPPGNRRSLLSGAKRRQWKSQNTPPTETDATCASPASVMHRDSQPRLKSASERPRTDHLDQQRSEVQCAMRGSRTPKYAPPCRTPPSRTDGPTDRKAEYAGIRCELAERSPPLPPSEGRRHVYGRPYLYGLMRPYMMSCIAESL